MKQGPDLREPLINSKEDSVKKRLKNNIYKHRVGHLPVASLRDRVGGG